MFDTMIKQGVYRRTTIQMSGTGVIKVDFAAEGSYADTVKTVLVEMVFRDRCPCRVLLGGQTLEHFLSRRRFEAAESGWYYSQSRCAALIKYPNPAKDITLTVSFDGFDLIGM